MSSVGRVSQADIMRVLIDRSLEDGGLDPNAVLVLLSTVLKENPKNVSALWTEILSRTVYDYRLETYRGYGGTGEVLRDRAKIEVRVRSIASMIVHSLAEYRSHVPVFFYGCVDAKNEFYLRIGRDGSQGQISLGPMFTEVSGGVRFRLTEAFELFLDHLKEMGYFQTGDIWETRPLRPDWPRQLGSLLEVIDPETGWFHHRANRL